MTNGREFGRRMEDGEDGSFDGKMKFNLRCLIFTCKCTCNFEDSFFFIYIFLELWYNKLFKYNLI